MTDLERRLAALEARLPAPASPRDAALRRADAWLVSVSGRRIADLSPEELTRMEAMFRAWPDGLEVPAAAILGVLDSVNIGERLPRLPDSLRFE
jgi:hypothetical protein